MKSLALGIATAIVLAGTALAAPGDTTLLVDVRGTGALGSSADALDPSVSEDGRYVAFETDSARLPPRVDLRIGDVFVTDTRLGRTELVSRASGRRGALDDEGSGSPSISADGRFVAFDGARNLGAPEGYRYPVLYVRDRRRHLTEIVSRASGRRGRLGTNASYEPAISGDGRLVAFSSEASNLDRADRSERMDVYARDLRTHRTFLVSRATGMRGAPGNGSSDAPSVSADGRYVAFASRASNLSPQDPDSRWDVFVRDLRRGRTILVSPGTGEAIEPAISPDGRYVAFTYSRATDLDPADDDRRADVYLADLASGEVELVSRTAGYSDSPSVSENGARVAFSSRAQDLDPDDTADDFDVYVYDRASGIATLASRASGAGPKAAGGQDISSSAPVLSADGRILAFGSNATNLHPDDTDDGRDIFLRDLGAG